jgi:hypothetical protein
LLPKARKDRVLVDAMVYSILAFVRANLESGGH